MCRYQGEHVARITRNWWLESAAKKRAAIGRNREEQSFQPVSSPLRAALLPAGSAPLREARDVTFMRASSIEITPAGTQNICLKCELSCHRLVRSTFRMCRARPWRRWRKPRWPFRPPDFRLPRMWWRGASTPETLRTTLGELTSPWGRAGVVGCRRYRTCGWGIRKYAGCLCFQDYWRNRASNELASPDIRKVNAGIDVAMLSSALKHQASIRAALRHHHSSS